MKKFYKLCLLTTTLLLTASSWATEFGGLLTNVSSFSGDAFDNLALDQSDTLSAWIRHPFDKEGKSYFTAEVLYKFEINPLMNEDLEAKNISAFDLNLLKYAMKKETNEGAYSLSIGRFVSRDLSGLVFSQNADGALLAYDSTTISYSLYGAYTGLLNGRTVSMLCPDGNWVEESDNLYQAAEKHLIGAAGLSFPNFLANQTFACQIMDTYRLEGNTFNRLYGEVQLNGPLSKFGYYVFNTIFNYSTTEFRGEKDSSLANLSRLSISIYPKVLSMAIILNGVYASGSQGPFKSFYGFSSQTAVSMNGGRTEYSDLLKGGATISVKPLPNMIFALTEEFVFDAADEIKYQGLYSSLALTWQIVSDVQTSLSSYFFKGEDTIYDKAAITATMSIAF